MRKLLLAILCWCITVTTAAAGTVIDSVSSDEKMVSLTIEDIQTTADFEKVINICEDSQVKVTFFVSGEFITANTPLIKKAIQQGHEFGNYGLNKQYWGKANAEGIGNELLQAQTILSEIGGKDIVRPTYQYYKDDFFKAVNVNLPAAVIVRGTEALDWTIPTPQAALAKIKAEIKPGNIININMCSKQSMGLLQILLPELKKMEYNVSTFSTLYARDDSRPAIERPFKIYFSSLFDKPNVALTFDDGGSYYQSQEILDILKFYNVKSTFFLLGNWIDANADLVRRMLAEGHEIANHTYSHPQCSQISADELVNELQMTSQAVVRAAGKQMSPLFRPPYGDYDDNVADVARNMGFKGIVLWNIDTLDWSGRSSDNMVQTVLAGVSNGSIVLFHLHGNHTAEALQELIPALRDRGYKLTTVTELLR